MLILTRKPGESLYIGDKVKITVVETKGNQIRIGIEAPQELRIYREEIFLQILEENKSAAAAATVPDTGLDALSDWYANAGEGRSSVQRSSLKRSKATARMGHGREQSVPEVTIKGKKTRKPNE